MRNSDALSFLQDDRFVKWVCAPDEETNAWWENWIVENPDKTEILLKAREIAMDLVYLAKPEGTEKLSEEIWRGIQSSLDAPGKTIPLRRLAARYWLAASFFGLLAVAAWLYQVNRSHTTPLPGSRNGSQQIASTLVDEKLERVNPTDHPQLVYLVDGTKVTLEPGSRIRYSAFLKRDKREVYLEGDAFFEVAKDAARPFTVETADLMVHVLGTSFRMATDTKNGDITVVVHSGKVAVSKKSSSPDKQDGSLTLILNQKALYKAQTGSLVQSVLQKDDLKEDAVSPEASGLSFNWEETAVIKIFSTLERAYGIPLYYDEKLFAGCVITTSLTDESFEEKLKIICEAIGADYKIDSKGVFIESKEGKPCR